MNEWLREVVRRTKANYPEYHAVLFPVKVDGVEIALEFHRVGHNASHLFYLGILPDGRIVSRSWGEIGFVDDNPVCGDRTHIFPAGEVPAYFGHW